MLPGGPRGVQGTGKARDGPAGDASQAEVAGAPPRGFDGVVGAVARVVSDGGFGSAGGRLAAGAQLAGDPAEEQIGQGEAGWVGHSALLGAGFAQAHFFHLAFDELGEEDAGFGIAKVTFHVRTKLGPTPREAKKTGPRSGFSRFLRRMAYRWFG